MESSEYAQCASGERSDDPVGHRAATPKQNPAAKLIPTVIARLSDATLALAFPYEKAVGNRFCLGFAYFLGL